MRNQQFLQSSPSPQSVRTTSFHHDALWIGESIVWYVTRTICQCRLLTLPELLVMILLTNAIAILSEDRFLARSKHGLWIFLHNSK
jgi:hypothetical protein